MKRQLLQTARFLKVYCMGKSGNQFKVKLDASVTTKRNAKALKKIQTI
jgi:hypothetical protein